MYRLHQAQAALLARLRPLARVASGLLRPLHAGRRPGTLPLAQAAASLQLLEGAGTTHRKPAFGLGPLRSGRGLAEVREEVVDTLPSAGCCASPRTWRAPGRACWWSRRNPAISPPGYAAPAKPCCPNTTC